jgi:hypothetical protein
MDGRQLSFMPETPDEDGDQLDLLEEVAALAHGPIPDVDCDGGAECPWRADRTHADDGLYYTQEEE